MTPRLRRPGPAARRSSAPLLALALLAASCGGGAEPGPADAQALVHAATQRRPAAAPAPASECFVGVITAERAVDMAAQVEGRLAGLPVALGAAVRQGQRLATLDSRPVVHQLDAERSRLAALRAEASRAELDIQQARRNLERTESLRELVSAEQIETAHFELRTRSMRRQAVAAEVEEVLSRVAALEDQAARQVVRAPFDGTVAWIYLSPGAVVREGDRILRLVDAAGRLVRFAMPPRWVPAIRPGTEVHVRGRGTAARARAVVETISPEIDAPSRLVFAQARLVRAPGDDALALGAAVDVEPAGADGLPCTGEV